MWITWEGRDSVGGSSLVSFRGSLKQLYKYLHIFARAHLVKARFCRSPSLSIALPAVIMAAATTCASSLAGQALNVAGKVNVGGACFLVKAKATDTICYEAGPDDYDSDSAGRFSDPVTSTKDPSLCRDNEVWQLTVGRLLRSGTSYFYERTKDSAYCPPKRSDITGTNYSYQRSEQSKEFTKMHLSTKRKPRAPAWHMTSNSRIDGTTTEAIAVLKKHLQQGINACPRSYIQVLQTCMKHNDLLATKQVHACMVQSGMVKNHLLAGTLMNVYIKSGALVDARYVFDQVETKSVIDWTIMIAEYAKRDDAESAFELFNRMSQEGVKPNEITYLSILNACASPIALKRGKQIHECIRHAGFDSDVRVGNALLNMYLKCGCIMEARHVFEKFTKRDVITWNTMIGGLAQQGCGYEAYKLFCQMRREGFQPDEFTYVSILNTSASAGPLQWVTEVHEDARKAGLESDLRVGTALVHMYAKSGSIDEARAVFDRLEKRDLFAWTAMIGGLAQHGCGHEALEYFSEMNAAGIKPDQTTFTAVLSACCHTGRLDDGRRLFLAMTQDHGIGPDIVQYNCMVDLLGRAGLLEESKRLIEEMPFEPGVITWTTFLGACRTYGNVELGEIAAKELFKLEPRAASAYVLLSNIYGAAGMQDKQESLRCMMEERGIRKEPGRSWIEVDKKIHEFLVGDLSHPEAKAIYTILKELTEKLKAEGYIPDIRLVLKNVDEADKESALCSHSEKLAIAYGLLHIPRGEPIRVFKNLRVCSDCHAATKLISKVTEREIIVRDVNRFHHFKDGVCSCGDYW